MSERPERAAEPTPSDDWRAVDSAAGPHPPLPPAVKWGGLGLLALLLVGAILAGIGLGGGFGSGGSSSPEPTPELTMEPPIQVGDYVRGRLSTTEPSASVGSTRQVGAEYSDGSVGIVFLMVWPKDDLTTFMTDAGIDLDAAPATPAPSSSPSEPATASASATTAGGDIVCGVSQDTERVACGKLVRGTGVMVAALGGQVEEEIRTLLGEFEQAVTP